MFIHMCIILLYFCMYIENINTDAVIILVFFLFLGLIDVFSVVLLCAALVFIH